MALHTRVVALGAALAFILGGCASAHSSDVPSQVPASTHPSPSPATESAPSVTITALSVVIEGGEGDQAWASTYFESAEDAVSQLTVAFGKSPEVVANADGVQGGAVTKYDWGGFAILDLDAPVDEPFVPEFYISAESAEVEGVLITTVDGISVGDSATDLENSHPSEAIRTENEGREYLFFYVGTEFVDSPKGRYPTSVALDTDSPEGSISQIRAPEPGKKA